MHTQEWIYRFGDVEVEPAAHRICRAGAELGVEPKAYAVLVALLEQHGKALERDALLDRVWGHRHVTPGVLNRVVAQLRKALGDDAEHPRYIQTLHSLGYRFIGEVERLPAAMRDAPVDEEEIVSPATEATPASDDSVPVPRRSRHFALASALALAVLAIGWLWQQQDPPRPEASIAVLPFASLSGRPEDSYFAEGLAVEMHDALAGVQGLTVAARMTPGDAQRRETDVKAIGRRLGVATVLDASVRRQGPRLRISARLADTRTGYTLWSRTYDRQVSDVFATQSEIASEVVHALVGKQPEIETALRRRLEPTQNLAAFDAYLRGLQQLLSEDGDAEQATGYFRNALAGDRGFARAQAGLCRAELRRFESFRNAEAFVNAREACDRARRMDEALPEVRYALAELYRLQGNLPLAAMHYRTLERDRTYRLPAIIGQANVAAAQGRTAEAFKRLHDALREHPRSTKVMAEIGFLHYQTGALKQALAWYRRAVDAAPGDAGMWSTYGALQLLAGNAQAAERALERSIAIQPDEVPLSNLGTLRYQACDYAGAAAMYHRAIELNPGDFMLWGNLGDALYADAATRPGAADAFREAVARGQRYIEIKSDDARAFAALGAYRASLGQAAAARALALRAEALGTERAEVAIYNAVTFALVGDAAAARSRIGSARAAGMDATRIATHAVLRQVDTSTPGSPVGRGGAPAPCASGTSGEQRWQQ